MALSLTWGGRVDTDVSFSEFFGGDHTVCVRFMLQWVNVYAGPMLAVHGRGTYFIGNEFRRHCPDHPYTVISVRIGSGAFEFEIPPSFKETWHHLAVVRHGPTCTVYLDGARRGTFTLSSSDNACGTLRLGRSEAAHQQYYGFLADVGVFTAALPEYFIAALSKADTLTGLERDLLAGYLFGDGPSAGLSAKLKRPLDYVPGARNIALSSDRKDEADRRLLPLSLVSFMRLPFAQGPARVMQGFCGTLSHQDYAAFAYDLDFPWATHDTLIRASAPGVVSDVVDGNDDTPDAAPNYVTIEQAPGEFCDYHHIRKGGFEVKDGEAVSCGTELAWVGMVHEALTNLGEHSKASAPGAFVTIPLPYCNYEYSDNCGFTWQHAIRGYLKEGQLVRNHTSSSPIRYSAAWTPGRTDEWQIYDVRYEEYRARYDELWPEGWRIHTLSIVVVNGVPLYTAVWRPGTSAEEPIYDESPEGFRARYAARSAQGWRVRLLTRCSCQNKIRYTAFLAPGAGDETTIYDASYEEYRARYDQLWPLGWRIKLIDVVERSQRPCYTVFWERSTAGEEREDYATFQRFRERYDELWPAGWRLRHLSTYNAPNGQITAVWHNTGEPEIWFHGLEYEEYRARYDVLWELGWRLKVLDRYTV